MKFFIGGVQISDEPITKRHRFFSVVAVVAEIKIRDPDVSVFEQIRGYVLENRRFQFVMLEKFVEVPAAALEALVKNGVKFVHRRQTPVVVAREIIRRQIFQHVVITFALVLIFLPHHLQKSVSDSAVAVVDESAFCVGTFSAANSHAVTCERFIFGGRRAQI